MWFLRRGRTKQETLFIDASNMGYMEDRTHRAFADEDVAKIRDSYLNWKKGNEVYEDEKGYCKSASLADIEKHNFILTPGRYVGIPEEEDDGIPYEDKIEDLTGKLTSQIQKESELNQEIKTQLAKVGITLKF